MTTSKEDVLSGLQQLIKVIEPTIKSASGSLEVAEDGVLHLEETDENFHKYGLVKLIRECIETRMGALIDEEIEKSSLPNEVSQQETLIQAVTEKAVESKLFSSVTQELRTATSSAINALLQSLEEEHHSASSDEDTESQLSKKMLSVFSEGEYSFGSSFNQGMFFMSQEQFHNIAQELNVRQPLNVRREALSRLCQVPPSDVMASEGWTELRISLMDALADNDPLISYTALSFHAKMFAVSHYQITRETYTCLAEHLLQWFKSASQLPLLSETLSLNNPVVEQILKRIRLLNEFQREVPLIWVRYPESYLEVIVDSTLTLLTVHLKMAKDSAQSNRVSALHFLALVDIKAHWFRRWLHGNYSRATIIDKLQEKFRSLLIEAVSQCLTYCAESLKNRKSPSKHIVDKVERRMTYTPKELGYIYFCHCLSLVTRLLLYSGGRNLFPLSISTHSHPVTVQHVLIACIKLLSLAKYKPKAGHKVYEPATLVGKAVCSLCASNAFVKSCVDAGVLNALLLPIKSWLDGNSVRASEAAMLHIAEVFASLTSTCSGRKLLMRINADDRRLSAAHVIAEFAQKTLTGRLPHNGHSNSSSPPSYPVICAYVFICRQIYNTCEGLLLLLDYQLHRGIATAWRQAHERRHDTHSILPLVGDKEQDVDEQSSPTQASSQNILVWEENLLDNLLNFAATPKGLFLLQQTGAIGECVTYMHSRYTKKLQVSKCEKFGYGVMVTQVAATAAGIKALFDAGYVRAIVREVWVNLECATDEIRMTAPRPHPLTPIDRAVHKPFMGLVNLLSSYAAVHEIFSGETLPNKSSYPLREVPQSPVDLIDRLLIINSDVKIHALFNYEQSLAFGVRLLTVLACNLDSWLLLETQYHIQDLLLDMQKNNRTDEGELIIDQLSVERNHLLVRTMTVGGDRERNLPERTLRMGSSSSMSRDRAPYVWPLFYKPTLPKEYTPTLPAQPSMKKESQLSRFLAKTKSSERNRQWLDQLRAIFVQVMTSHPDTLRGGIIAEVLEKAIMAQERTTEERVFKKKSGWNKGVKEIPNVINSSVVSAGVKIAIGYGKHVNALKANSATAVNNLTNVIKTCFQHLAQQQTYSPSLKLTSKPYPCHDWFASTIFLIMSGNKDRTISFLMKIAELFVSGYLWPARLHASIHLSDQMRSSGIPPMYCCFGHHFELILQTELPSVYFAFRMSGFTPSQISQHWLTQCFWNYLTWTQISHYISTVVIMGVDYQVYFCVSIMKHLQHKILVHRQSQDLQVFLKENALEGFAVADWIHYMVELEKKYRVNVLASMRNIVNS